MKETTAFVPCVILTMLMSFIYLCCKILPLMGAGAGGGVHRYTTVLKFMGSQWLLILVYYV